MINDIIDYTLLNELDIKFIEENLLLPIKKQQLFTVVMAVDNNQEKYLESVFNTPIKYIFKDIKYLTYVLEHIKIKQDIYILHISALEASLDDTKSYISLFIEQLISYAILKQSSDIHIETLNNSMIIRLRIDGHLEVVVSFKNEFFGLLSSYIKLLSNMDISQKRVPQDGRFSKDINGSRYDFRVSTLPTINGESIVLRILDNNTISKNLNDLGITSNNLNTIKHAIKEQSGLILVTGPTGSGKTTTLYAILEELNATSKKIITIEDTVEYHIENIQQVNVNKDIGLDFTDVLKNILRQDPDIIMIGEIRDGISLKIAMQAALTGHLVLATLHTNDAMSTINRLIDLDTPAYLVASTLKTIISQRLIRKLCESCKKYNENTKSYKANGCNKCNIKGYISREVISEVLTIDENIASLIVREEYHTKLKPYLNSIDYKTIFEDGLSKVQDGKTTQEELYSLISC
jgi:general secretion pathway protein E